MSYLLDRKNKKKKIWQGAISVLVLGLLFFSHSNIFYGLAYGGSLIAKPFLYSFRYVSAGFGNLSGYFVAKNKLNSEIAELESELAFEKAKSENTQSLLSENEKLKEILGRKNTNLSLTLATILSKRDRSLYDTLVIDAGSDQGISAGSLVYAYGNIPIGRIDMVFKNTSRVVLFSNSKEETGVVLNGVHLQLVGRGGGNFEMILPRDLAITSGMQAVLPGITPYVVANVETVISDPRDAFQKVLFASPVNIEELNFVQIAK